MSARRVAFLIARVVIFGVLIVFVGRQIHWQDTVTELAPSGNVVHHGRVVERHKDSVVLLKRGDTRIVFSRDSIEDRRPTYGLRTILERMNRGLFGIGFACMAGTIAITMLRWHRLAHVRDISLRLGEAFRLSFIGLFFNNAVPGATGGDVMKAYYAARDRDKKADVFASVFVDRIIGLIALVTLAGGVILFQAANPEFSRLATNIFLLLALILCGAAVYFSRRLRRVFGISKLVEYLPFQELFRKLDKAFFLYRFHKGSIALAFLMSLAAHSFTILSHVMIGRALKLEVPIYSYFVYVPIGQVLSALPIFPGGWGVREAAYGSLFMRGGLPFSYGVALSILHGLVVLGWSLFGGLLFLLGNERLPPDRKELAAAT